LHTTIEAVSRDIFERYQFNTAISSLMKLTNTLADYKSNVISATYKEALLSLILMLFPMAPHISSELWELLHSTSTNKNICNQKWPEFKQEFVTSDIITLVVQIQGKMRGTINIDKTILSNEKEVLAQVESSSIGIKKLTGKSIKKVIQSSGKNYAINILGN